MKRRGLGTRAEQRKLNGWPQDVRNAKLSKYSDALLSSSPPEPSLSLPPNVLDPSPPDREAQSPNLLGLPLIPSSLNSLPLPVETSLISAADNETESPQSRTVEASNSIKAPS